jgi:hypothetical protein
MAAGARTTAIAAARTGQCRRWQRSVRRAQRRPGAAPDAGSGPSGGTARTARPGRRRPGCGAPPTTAWPKRSSRCSTELGGRNPGTITWRARCRWRVPGRLPRRPQAYPAPGARRSHLLSRCARLLARRAGTTRAATSCTLLGTGRRRAGPPCPAGPRPVVCAHAVDGKRRSGRHGAANFKKAIRWLQLAGEQGLAEAWYALSRIYT